MARYASVQQELFSKSAVLPSLITQEEYEAKWKPAGWKLIIIGPTATWRTEWGVWEAIRDIVQNSLDETESYQYGYTPEGLWIGDKGRGIAVADFLLGPPKLKPDYARGKFGEGMKIASLALLRLGHGVHVETVGRELWIVFLEQKINGRVQQLAALWRNNGTRAGTRFHIVGYQGSSYAELFTANLPRSAILAEVAAPVTRPKQRYNQLIRAEGAAGSAIGGRIYCRDIWLRNIQSPFSYNLWGFELSPDRHGPKEETSMHQDMGRLWSGVNKVSLIKLLLAMITDPTMTPAATYETLNLRLDRWMGNNPVTDKPYINTMVDNARLWRQAWDEVIGKHTVIRTDSSLDGMVTHLGYNSHSVQWEVRDALLMVIKTDAALMQEMAERLDRAERIPDRNLTGRQPTNIKLARRIAEGFRGVGDVNAGIIPPASDAVERTAGLYEFGTGMIKISTSMLEDARKTVGVMVHELGHHVAFKNTGSMERASDLTPEHAQAMENVAGRIFRSLATGAYDDILKDTNFVW